MYLAVSVSSFLSVLSSVFPPEGAGTTLQTRELKLDSLLSDAFLAVMLLVGVSNIRWSHPNMPQRNPNGQIELVMARQQHLKNIRDNIAFRSYLAALTSRTQTETIVLEDDQDALTDAKIRKVWFEIFGLHSSN